MQKILHLVETRGPAMLLRKHLVRTGLIAALRELRTQLDEYYGGTTGP